MYDYKACSCKYFPLDDVRISGTINVPSRRWLKKPPEYLILLGFCVQSLDSIFWRRGCNSLGGATRYQWLTPPRYLAVIRVRKITVKHMRRYRHPTTVAPFLFCGFG